MRHAVTIAACLLALAAGSRAERSASEVVLGSGRAHLDCPPSQPPAATPTAEPTPLPAARQVWDELREAGFKIDWERGNELLVTLPDEGVNFDHDKDVIKAGGIEKLERLAGILRRYPDNSVSISGHTDSSGRRLYNMDLSRRRSESVRRALESMGMGASRFTTPEGFGPDKPVAPNELPQDMAKNRRVEVRLKFHEYKVKTQGPEALR